MGESEHLINATTVDGRLLVGRADCEDLRQGGGRSGEGGIREVGFLTFEKSIKRLFISYIQTSWPRGLWSNNPSSAGSRLKTLREEQPSMVKEERRRNRDIETKLDSAQLEAQD